MVPPSWLILAIAGIALLRLLWAEHSHSRLGIYVFKPLTSCCFIAYALAQGAWQTPYGRILLVAQGLCWVGDVLLMLPGYGPFLAGLVSFFAGHAGYTVAFVGRVQAPAALPTGVFTAIVLGASVAIACWLAPHVPKPIAWPVRGYVAMITLMTIAAAAQTTWPQGPFFALVGAILFYVSDICVARERFVRPSPAHTYGGLPLYYAGQMLLAASVRPGP